jgi:segregation and condensation protein B
MAKKKIEEQLPLEAAALAEDTKKEGGVLPDEEPRNVVFEEALEAILFAAGHPISYATLARVFETTPSKVRDMVLEYSLKYNNSDIPRGVIMLVFKDSCQLCTKKYYLNEIREALGIRKSGTLSTSSMEVLAIVAYNQPVTRVFVDTLRRADSSYAMNNLLDRGLIESKGRLDAPGRPMLYGTTNDFLRCFGLKDLKELPQTSEEIQSMFANTSNVPEDAEGLEITEQLSLEESIDEAKEETPALSENTESGEDKSNEEIHNADDSEYDEPSADEHIDFDDEPSADEDIDFSEE